RHMAQAHRVFEGEVAVACMARLVPNLASSRGSVRYVLAFDADRSGRVTFVLHAVAELVLNCQRSLEPFGLPTAIDQRFGVIASEAEEPSLPDGCEALLSEDGMLDPRAVIEDELILALPLVPVRPGSEPVDSGTGAAHPEREHPFAAL